MDRNYLIETTKEIYRLSLFFPRKEPLRYKLREISTEILNNFIRLEIHLSLNYNMGGNEEILGLLEEIEVLEAFFIVIKEQNWIKQQDISDILERYKKTKNHIKSFNKQNSFDFYKKKADVSENQDKLDLNEKSLFVQKKELVIREDNEQEKNQQNHIELKEKTVKVSPRQEKIIEYVKSNGKTQVGDIKSFFPEITKRTLRRDFMHLLNQGMIHRIGEKNNTFYIIKES